jgi:hypothetical protein
MRNTRATLQYPNSSWPETNPGRRLPGPGHWQPGRRSDSAQARRLAALANLNTPARQPRNFKFNSFKFKNVQVDGFGRGRCLLSDSVANYGAKKQHLICHLSEIIITSEQQFVWNNAIYFKKIMLHLLPFRNGELESSRESFTFKLRDSPITVGRNPASNIVLGGSSYLYLLLLNMRLIICDVEQGRIPRKPRSISAKIIVSDQLTAALVDPIICLIVLQSLLAVVFFNAAGMMHIFLKKCFS